MFEHRSRTLPIYQASFDGELLFVLCLLAPDDPRIPNLWRNQTLQQLLKQPLMSSYRIRATYLYVHEEQRTEAQDLLAKGFAAAVKQVPNAGDSKTETKLNRYLWRLWGLGEA